MFNLYDKLLKDIRSGNPEVAIKMFKEFLKKDVPSAEKLKALKENDPKKYEKIIENRDLHLEWIEKILEEKLDNHHAISLILNNGVKGKIGADGKPIKAKKGKDKKVDKTETADGEAPRKSFKDMSDKEMEKYAEENLAPYLTKEHRNTPEGKRARKETVEYIKEEIKRGLDNEKDTLELLTSKDNEAV